MMNRRAFVTGLGAVLAAPRAAVAQQAGKVWRIGHVSQMSPAGMAPYVAALEAGLRDLGYVQGQNIVIVHRSANDNPELVATAAAELVRLNVDVIVTGINQGVAAAKQATTTIPIVMVYGIDPVGAGFIASLARPGGNVTGGTYDAAPELYAKILELTKEAIPRLGRVAFLWNRAFPGAATHFRVTRDAASRIGVKFQSVEIRAVNKLEDVFEKMSRAGAEVVIVAGDPLVFPARGRIAELAAKYRVPMVASWREFTEAGGFMSYGLYALERWRHAATYVDKILRGAKPADLPVEQPTKFELWINLKTAKALGLTIPPSLLARADQVIE